MNQNVGFHSAGWFPDPWRHAPLRWWDGYGWTAHTDLGPDGAVADGARMAKWLSIAILFLPVLNVAASWFLGRLLREISDLFRNLLSAPGAQTLDHGRFGLNRSAAGMELIALIGWIPLLLRMVWTYRITGASRRLGRNTRYTAGLACATWIIPIACLWMPYQAVHDAFPNGVPPRTPLAWWWAAYLVAPILTAVAGFAGGLSDGPAGLAWLAAGLTAGVVGMLLDRRIIASVTEAQTSALATLRK